MDDLKILPIETALNLRDYLKFKKYLICNFCKGITKDPFFCESCLVSFCERCLPEKSLEIHCCSKCSLEIKSALQDFNKIFSNLIIKCQTCSEIYVYPTLLEHKCNRLSNEIYIKCEFCYKEVQSSKYTVHLINSCTEYYIKCKYCNRKIEVIKAEAHSNTCEEKIKYTCPICNEYIQLNFYQHYYNCSINANNNDENLNKSKQVLNKDNNDKSYKKDSFISKINDEPIHNHNYPLLSNEINNLTLMLSLILKGNETSFCRKCHLVKKLNDLICCTLCRKAFCSFCCIGCKFCVQIFDKDCFKQCFNCGKVICGICNKNSKNLCLCEEIKFCGDSCLNISNYKHLCKYIQKLPQYINHFIINTEDLLQFKLSLNITDDKMNSLYYSLFNIGDTDFIFKSLKINSISDTIIFIYNTDFVEIKTSKDYVKINIKLIILIYFSQLE